MSDSSEEYAGAIALPVCANDDSRKPAKRGERNMRKRGKLRSMSKSEKRQYFAEKAAQRAQKECSGALELTKETPSTYFLGSLVTTPLYGN